MAVQHELFIARVAELKGDLSDAAFARRVGIAPSTFQRYQLGSFPSADIAARIAETYDVSVDWLLGRAAARQLGQASVSRRYLSEALRIVEDWLEQNSRVMGAEKKADVVIQLYELIADDVARGRGPVDVKRLHGILRLVA